MIKLFSLAVMLCAMFIAQAQSSSGITGARASGLGYASACLHDEWSVFNNIGGLAHVDQHTIAFTYHANPSVKAFNRMALTVALPFTFGVVGVGAFRFGDALYNEHLISAGFSHTLGLASLGVKANYVQYRAEGFGGKSIVSFTAGGIAQITPQLSAGAYIINLNHPNLSSSIETEKLPTTLVAGVAFKFSEKTFITTEIEKDLEYDATWKTGIEYTIHKKIIFRTGFALHPSAGFIGSGFHLRKFILDYAYSYHLDTGSNYHATVSCTFKKNKK